MVEDAIFRACPLLGNNNAGSFSHMFTEAYIHEERQFTFSTEVLTNWGERLLNDSLV